MLKRVYGNRPDWKRVVQREYYQTSIEDIEFSGHITLLKIKKVTEPLFVQYGEKKICIVDDGYMWLQHFPTNKHYSVTTMFNENGEVVQWYIDICYRIGIDERQIPWMDDLFLDIVVLNTGEVIRKDADELAQALHMGWIDQSMFNLANTVEEALLHNINKQNFQLLNLVQKHKDYLLGN
ncbi:DUF402 domain-containing protein [Cytobacillus suaedae]|nr:DUF402 domain-containing protein [Cytobacillus suaedae]